MENERAREAWDAEASEAPAAAAVPRGEDDARRKKKRAEASRRAWDKAVASSLDACVAEDRAGASVRALHETVERRRLASLGRDAKRRDAARDARNRKERAAHATWLNKRKTDRENALHEAAARYGALGGVVRKAAAPTRTTATATTRTTPRRRPGAGLSTTGSRPLRGRLDAALPGGPLGLELGLSVAADGDEAAVVKSVAGAAAAAGVVAGDVLVAVGERDCRGYSFSRCVGMVRDASSGGAGVTLGFQRTRRSAPPPPPPPSTRARADADAAPFKV